MSAPTVLHEMITRSSMVSTRQHAEGPCTSNDAGLTPAISLQLLELSLCILMPQSWRAARA